MFINLPGADGLRCVFSDGVVVDRDRTALELACKFGGVAVFDFAGHVHYLCNVQAGRST